MTNQKLIFYCNLLLPKKEWLLAFVMLAFAVNQMSAQGKTISGVVTSGQDNLPLPGVNIVIKGTKTVAVSGFDGEYTINASPNDVLVFSFIGFINKEITVGSQTKVNAVLTEDTNKLNEVVVIGYGTQKKSDLTGSVSVVNLESAKKTVTYDAAKMLQGQVPGVTVQSSGEPGGFVNVKIRGITSFTNNNPLFVIDGIMVDAPYDFAPGEIESMQVLKDASSAAIYGVRGANGVVIITTKKGKAGRMDIKFKSIVGLQNVAKKWDVTDRAEYQRITSEAERNRDLRAGVAVNIAPGNNPSSPSYITNVNTDWQKESFQTGVVQNQALTFNGGAESLAYSFNIDYFKNSSYIRTPQDYERLSTNLNLNGKKGKFKYGAKIGYTQSDKEIFNEYNVGQTVVSDILGAIPTMPVYDSKRLGGYGGTDNLTQRAISMNPIGFNNLIENSGKRNRFLGDVWGELEILPGLKYKLDVSYDRTDWQNRKFMPPSDLGWYYVTENDEASLDLTNGNELRTFMNNLLTYEITLGKHKLDALAGWIQERRDNYEHISRGVGYKPGEISMLQYADSRDGREYKFTITGISYISRLNYAYDDRYLLQANFRQDKTSLFSKINNSANFYSFSGGWRISNEKFIKLPSWVSNIKLRGGYGTIGNNTIPQYFFASTVNSFASYDFNNELAPGTTVVSALDPNVHWEKTTSSNVGIELGFLDNDLQFTAEYFKKKVTDILVKVPLPFSTGAFPAEVFTNAGNMENHGLEFTASYSNHHHKFKYDISANFGTLRNKVTKIGINANPLYAFSSKTEVGRSVGELYAWEAIGIFQNAAEVAASPTQTNAAPGDVKFRDVNGDGRITDADRTFQGVTIPKYGYGLNFSASYSNFDFSMFWQGSGGNKVLNTMYRNLMLGQYTNHHKDELNYWTPTNTNTNVPAPVIGDPNGNARESNRFIESGDYVKLQTMEIGYTIPLKDKFIEKAKVYINGQNLLIISKYKGYDPDFNSDGLLARGIDGGSLPNPRTISLGVEVNF